jgi:hypothetical protein
MICVKAVPRDDDDDDDDDDDMTFGTTYQYVTVTKF